jgi:hypothetical protein
MEILFSLGCIFCWELGKFKFQKFSISSFEDILQGAHGFYFSL